MTKLCKDCRYFSHDPREMIVGGPPRCQHPSAWSETDRLQVSCLSARRDPDRCGLEARYYIGGGYLA